VRVTPISLLACEFAGSQLVLDEHLLTEGRTIGITTAAAS